MTAFTVHLGAVLSHAQWPAITCHDLWMDDLLMERLEVQDGYIRVPEGPGLGVEVDEEAIERYRVEPGTPSPKQQYLAQRRVLRIAILTSGFTFILMAILWLPALSMLFDPERDIANFGMPLLLYEPLASFIAWIVLMVVISPFLQVLTTVFGASVSMASSGADRHDDPVSGSPYDLRSSAY